MVNFKIIGILLSVCLIALTPGLFDASASAQDSTVADEEVKAAVTENPDKEGFTLFTLLYKGGWIMIPIGLASVLALTLSIERFLSIRKKKILPSNFLSGLKSLFSSGDLNPDKGREYCSNNPCIFGNLIKNGFPKVDKGEKALQHAMEDAGAREVDRLKRSLKPLSMIATIAPLLGLLGTVYGMIGAFQAASNAGSGKSDVLAQGIYEALVTTAAGLTLAIPVLIIYQILNNRIDNIVDDIDESAEEFMNFALSSETT